VAPWVLDLDGVVWLAGRPLAGAPEAIAALRAAGHRVAFVTNNSNPTVAQLLGSLRAIGVEAEPDDVVGSATVTATLVEPGERVLVCGGPGLSEAMVARGAEVVYASAATASPDVVAVGLNRDFDYEWLGVAATAIRAGARFVASNDDATFPTPDGLVPGAGAIVAAIATAAGTAPVVAGKPYRPMVEFLRAGLGDHGTIVGDRPDTDGRLARALGWRFALVLTGVTSAEDLPIEPTPDDVADDLAALVAREAAARPR
jgi:HAD superfamily hydrolase (TIGR01450 family)